MTVDGYECITWGKGRHTFDFYIDGKPLDIPINANFMYIWGYNLVVDWVAPSNSKRQTCSFLGYDCTLDGAPLNSIDWEAFRKMKPGHHKLEMASNSTSMVVTDEHKQRT